MPANQTPPQTDHDLLIEIRTTLNLFVSDTTKKVDDHEDRLRAVERKVWFASGIATILGAVFGVAGNEMMTKLFG